jgi:hypothetical protein
MLVGTCSFMPLDAITLKLLTLNNCCYCYRYCYCYCCSIVNILSNVSGTISAGTAAPTTLAANNSSGSHRASGILTNSSNSGNSIVNSIVNSASNVNMYEVMVDTVARMSQKSGGDEDLMYQCALALARWSQERSFALCMAEKRSTVSSFHCFTQLLYTYVYEVFAVN